MAPRAGEKRKEKPRPWGAVTILNELEDLRMLAAEAASHQDYCCAMWLSRFERHLERHGRLSLRQQEVVADARARYGVDLAEAWLR